jgi:hypothetical protein
MIEISLSELIGALGISGATITIVSLYLHVYRKSDSRDKNTFQISESYRPPPASEGTNPSKKAEWILWITAISLTLLAIMEVGWNFMKFAGLAIIGSFIAFAIFELIDRWTENSSNRRFWEKYY